MSSPVFSGVLPSFGGSRKGGIILPVKQLGYFISAGRQLHFPNRSRFAEWFGVDLGLSGGLSFVQPNQTCYSCPTLAVPAQSNVQHKKGGFAMLLLQPSALSKSFAFFPLALHHFHKPLMPHCYRIHMSGHPSRRKPCDFTQMPIPLGSIGINV